MLRRDLRSASRLAALAIVTLATACSTGTTASDASVSTLSGPVPSTSTSVPTLGPAAPTSVAAGQTVPGQVSTSSTVAVAVDPAVELAVKKGVQDFFAAYLACGQAPANCHAGDFHSTRGTAVGQGTVYFQGLAARGEYFGSDLRGSYIVTQSVALDDATSAVAFSCWYDASILLGPIDATGQPAVLNDKIISVREKQSLYFDGADWKVGEAATVQDLGDGNKCPPPDPAG